MRISEVASRTGLNISNVRFYERKGLLMPDREEESKYRDYTEEDIKRIKQILLYRKMGVSVDTIYLLLNGQADRREVLLRQESQLRQQIENLQGAKELCGLMLREESLDDEKLDQYLNYVHKEEAQGKKFAEVEELLEDIVEYTKTNIFRWDPMVVWMFQNPWVGRLISLGLWGIVIAVPALHLFNVFTGKEQMKIALLIMFAVIIATYAAGFLAYRRARQKYEEEGK